MSTRPVMIADRYRVLEEAGRGGMGSVYRCIDERLGREVAVKQVGRMPGESVTHRARALREARSSAALNHPNVVSVYDAVAEGDHVWLVMEYVPGRTLAQMLREDGPLPPTRVAWIGAQVADGLAAAHARGTVHRDVKPGNVLVTEDDHARISDFGIARTAGDATLTQSGILTGTPGYFAPEVARGGDPGPASDVWALGATLYAAAEGRPPYDDNANALALLATIAAEPPPPPERAGPLTEPINRMLDRDPGSRWSMSEVASALHRVHAREGSREETMEQTREDAAAAPVGSAVAEEDREPVPADPPAAATSPVAAGSRPRRGRGVLLVAGLVTLLVLAIGALLLLDDGEEEPAASDGTSTDASPSDASPSDQTEDAQDTAPVEPEPTTSEPSETTEAPPPRATGGAAFVEDYYALLPEDTEAGYEQLSPPYQQRTSFGEYDGFWSTVDDVVVEDTETVGPEAVDVSLLYNGSEREVRRIYLERDQGGWLITDDEPVR